MGEGIWERPDFCDPNGRFGEAKEESENDE
jgi:hypothetical protein